VDARADLWSLGCLFFELLTGEFLFEDDARSCLPFVLRVIDEDQPLLTADQEAMLGHNRHLIAFVRAVVVRRPFLRPTVDEIRRKFETMYRQLFPAPSQSVSSASLSQASTAVRSPPLVSSALQPDTSASSSPAWLGALLNRRGGSEGAVDGDGLNVAAFAAVAHTATNRIPNANTSDRDNDNRHVVSFVASVSNSVRAAADELVLATAVDAQCDDGDGDDNESESASAAYRKHVARHVSAASASMSAASALSFPIGSSSSALLEGNSVSMQPPQVPLVATMSSHAAAASTAEPKSQSSASSSSSLAVARTAASTSSSLLSSSISADGDALHDAWRGPLLSTVSTAAPNLLFGNVSYLAFLHCILNPS
jgi:serine/threonine protein kinase